MEYTIDLSTYMRDNIQKVLYKDGISSIDQLRMCAPAIMTSIQKYFIPVLEQAIHDVYFINYKRRAGSLPEDVVIQSINFHTSATQPWLMTIFLDDTLVGNWLTSQYEPIKRIGGPDEEGNPYVTNFQNHWRCPLFNRMTEEGFMENRLEKFARFEFQRNEVARDTIIQICRRQIQKLKK
jgi:hypothetical protein